MISSNNIMAQDQRRRQVSRRSDDHSDGTSIVQPLSPRRPSTPSPSTTRTTATVGPIVRLSSSSSAPSSPSTSVPSSAGLVPRVSSRSNMTSIPILLILLSSCLSLVSCDCVTDFDAVSCDFDSMTGFGFKGQEKWDLECYPDEINVIQGTNRPSVVGPVSAVFSDMEFTYLVQGQKVLVTKDPTLESYQHVMDIPDLLSGYNKTIVTAFFHKEQVFVFDGYEFTIFNQRVFRAAGQPAWSFRTMDDARRRLTHEKLGTLKTSLIVPIPESRDSDLILLLAHKMYYKMSIGHCLPQDAGAKKFKDLCFWPQGAKQMGNLVSCVWISWKMMILILVICLLALLITCYVCCLLICYRRHRKSGTFKHEDQNCCQDGDHFLDDSNFCKETHKLNPTTDVNGKNGTTHRPSNGFNSNGKAYADAAPDLDEASVIVDGFAEDRLSVDLNEATYKQ